MLVTTCDNCGRHGPCDWVPTTAKDKLPHWRTIEVACSTCMRQVASQLASSEGRQAPTTSLWARLWRKAGR